MEGDGADAGPAAAVAAEIVAAGGRRSPTPATSPPRRAREALVATAVLRQPRLLSDPVRAQGRPCAKGRSARVASRWLASTRPDAVPQAKARLRRFLADGAPRRHGLDGDHRERRGDPRALWPDVRSVIVLGLNYGPDHDPLGGPRATRARRHLGLRPGRRLPRFIKRKLKALARWLAQARRRGEGVRRHRPVLEKPLAERAGLGWQGKHTNLVSREFGSWLFLGAILTTLELAPDEPEPDHCGTCQRLPRRLPDRGFPAPYQLDARRCISYLTIEHKGPIPRELRAADRQPHLRLRRLPGGLPLEQVRAGGPRAEARGARRRCARRRWPNSRAWTMRPSARCSPRARSSASAATGSCATC